MKYASCMDVSTEKGPNTTCVCQLARIMNEDRTEVKSIFYKSNLENPSAFKISSNGPHISVHPAHKYAVHLRKF